MSDSRFAVVQVLALNYPTENFSIAEQRNDQFSVVATIDGTCHDLVYNIVNCAVKKVVPGKGKKHILNKQTVRYWYRSIFFLENSLSMYTERFRLTG